MTKAEKLEEIADRGSECTRCSLYKGTTQPVPGDGNPDAKVMFIGEGPGFHEDQQGLPFVGASGKLLDQLLQLIKLERKEVFIGNVIKCRPPGNRDPLPEGIEACRPFLDRQIELISPRMIVALGRFSMERFFPGAKISQVHGQPRKRAGIIYYPMYHPAAALHQPKWRQVVEDDMSKIPQLLARADAIADVEL